MSTIKNFTIKNGVSVSGEATSTNIDITKSIPSISPSLSVDFAKTKTLASGITFIRNTTGTYVGQDGLLKTAAVNEPRFEHDPVTLVSKGLLVEDTRTNLLTYSEDFTNAIWYKDSCTVTANQVIAPDGNTTGEKMTSTVTGGANNCFTHQLFTVANDTTTRTSTIFVKQGTSPTATFNIMYSFGTFIQAVGVLNFTTGVYSVGGAAGATGFAMAYPNGWYKLSLTLTNNNTGNTVYATRLYVRDQGTTNVTGEYVYIWGAQAEVGDFPTSYIPTTTASVSRGIDWCWMENVSWYNQSEGTFRVSGYKNYQPTSFPWLFSATTASGNADCVGVFYYSVAGVIEPLVRVGNVVQYNVWTEAYPINTLNTITMTYKVNDFNVSVNGGTLVPDTSGNLPTITRLRFGHGDTPWNGHIANLTYYPKRLTDTQVQNLSI